jgi:hypothetical protein
MNFWWDDFGLEDELVCGVCFIAGIYDMDCNFMGTDKWLGEMQWFV